VKSMGKLKGSCQRNLPSTPNPSLDKIREVSRI
jgi:hypothetical protein